MPVVYCQCVSQEVVHNNCYFSLLCKFNLVMTCCCFCYPSAAATRPVAGFTEFIATVLFQILWPLATTNSGVLRLRIASCELKSDVALGHNKLWRPQMASL